MRMDVPKLTERLEDFGAGWRVGAESILDMIDRDTAAYIVTRARGLASDKITRRGVLSVVVLGLVALVTRIATRGKAIG